MKIFGIGTEIKEKKEDVKDTSYSKDSRDNQDPNDIIKDSLRVCYSSRYYSRYQNFVEQIKNEGWNYEGDVQSYALNVLNNNIVNICFLGQGMYGTFLEIMCPSPYYMVTVCGFDDAGIDPYEFYSHPNLYKTPHFFSITCADNNGKELSSNTIIDISKEKSNGESNKLFSEPYGDLSQRVGERFRRKEERYYFSASIKLNDNERLSFGANFPDIDIENTKLFMKADLFINEI